MTSYRDIVAEIRAERERQIATEGYSESHDDDHANGELKIAANCYYTVALREFYGEPQSFDAAGVPFGWPWGKEFWKPKSPRRMLIIAAALFRAEIDRLKRRKDRYEHLEAKVEGCISHIIVIDSKQ